MLGYAVALLDHRGVVEAFTAWVARTAAAVRSSVLATKLLQLTVLGVADVYQGSEITQTSLVDPDNRRPVDFAALAARLDALDGGARPAGLDDEKLRLTAAALRLRRTHRAAFVGESAGYEPLPTTTGHAVALARTDADGPRVVAVAARLGTAPGSAYALPDAAVVLPEGTWREVLTGARVPGGSCRLGDLLGTRPVALLERTA